MTPNKKIYIVIFNIFILFTGCRKDGNVENSIQKWDIYLPYSVTTEIPVDLNFDGVSNSDLTKELPIDSCSIYIQQTNLNPVIDINWIEPQFNKSAFLQKLPDTLSSTSTIRYLPAAQQYYFHDLFTQGKRVIFPNAKLVNDNMTYYTFVFPDSVNLNGDLLQFSTKQDIFISRKLHKQISIFAVFKKDREVSR